MVLAIDIGNTSVSIGVFAGKKIFVKKIPSFPALSSETYRKLIGAYLLEKTIDKPPLGGVISSVVPALTAHIADAVGELTGKEPLIVNYKDAAGLRFKVRHPEQVGPDRVAAAVAAVELYGAPVSIVDFGTATTVGFIGKGNIFRGGGILPGVSLMSRSLSSGTASLPEVNVEDAKKTRRFAPVGKDTEDSILSAIVLGTAGAVERIIEEAEAANKENYKIVITGGHMGLIALYLRRPAFKEPDIVLKGLRYIFEASGNA